MRKSNSGVEEIFKKGRKGAILSYRDADFSTARAIAGMKDHSKSKLDICKNMGIPTKQVRARSSFRN